MDEKEIKAEEIGTDAENEKKEAPTEKKASEKPEKPEKPDKSDKKDAKELKKVTAELAKKEEELAAANDKYLRMIAEYDNYRRRSQKEKEAAYADAYGDALSEILPVIDNLERALMFTDGDSLTEGVKMTLKQFEDALKHMGVEAYGERGEAFDPRLHNAVMMVEDETLGESTIAEVLQRGYKKGDKIIRDAMVKVAN